MVSDYDEKIHQMLGDRVAEWSRTESLSDTRKMHKCGVDS